MLCSLEGLLLQLVEVGLLALVVLQWTQVEQNLATHQNCQLLSVDGQTVGCSRDTTLIGTDSLQVAVKQHHNNYDDSLLTFNPHRSTPTTH